MVHFCIQVTPEQRNALVRTATEYRQGLVTGPLDRLAPRLRDAFRFTDPGVLVLSPAPISTISFGKKQPTRRASGSQPACVLAGRLSKSTSGGRL